MRVAVVGGGVIGVTTAYYLARAGHEVELLERRGEVAAETSFANAGQVSPGYSAPWAGPSVPLKALHWLTMRHGPLVVRPKADPRMWRWLLAMLRNCTAERYAVNKARMVPLAEHSRDCLRALRAETGIAYDERSRGTLQLFRTEAQRDGVAKDVAVLRELGVPHEVLDRQGCIAAEPGLARSAVPFAGGLRLPGDETGDCRMFTEALAGLAAGAGVRISLGTEVRGIAVEGGAFAGIATADGIRRADACVVAAGSYSPALLAPLGLSLPVYPVKGYSLTIPMRDAGGAPVSTVLDETYKIAITRLGDRIRVGGTAEVAGFDLALRPGRRATLAHCVGELFPDAGDPAEGLFWCGLRPMTPDGPPLVGATRVKGVYLNTGHGTLGWTMACGSAEVLSAVIGGRRPAVDMTALSLDRYGR